MSHPEPAPPRSSFPTTQWSLVADAGSIDEPTARAALDTLCRRYWYPLYAFIRRRGHPHHAAEDLTQGFFAQLLDSELIDTARAERGRFRTLLLTAVTHFLTDEWRRTHAQKRAGGQAPLPLEITGAEERYAAEPRDPGLTPEESFDRTWALSLIDHALTELREEYVARGRGALYTALASHLWTNAAPESYAAVAGRLSMSEHALTMAVSRLRERLRKRLSDHVAATVHRESDIPDELRHLLTVVRQEPPPDASR